MQVLHERMPVIVDQQDWPVWLGERAGDPAGLMRPAGNDLLHLWPVSRAVNSVRNDGAHLLDRIDDQHAPPPTDMSPSDNPL